MDHTEMDSLYIYIECSRTVKNILCEALLNFAYFSDEIRRHEDKDSIRHNVLELTHELDKQFAIDKKSIKLQKIHYDYCERAINYHYDRIVHLLGVNVDQQRKLMLNFLNGSTTRDEHLDAALLQDNII